MASLNKVTLIGRLGRKPELRHTQGGQAVANFSLATDEGWKDKSGEHQKKTEWHRVVVWGNQATTCEKYLDKGRQVYIEGRLQTREWEKEGQKQYTTEIVASRVLFLSGGNEGGGGGDYNSGGGNSGGGGGYSSGGNSGGGGGGDNFSEEDIPF